MSRINVFGLIPRFEFYHDENGKDIYLAREIHFDRGVTICKPIAHAFYISQYSKEYLSKKDRDMIKDSIFGVRLDVETRKSDEFEKIDKAINDIHLFIAMLRIVKPVLAYPKLVFAYCPSDKHISVKGTSHLDSCYSVEDTPDLRKFSIDCLPEVNNLWKNLPQVSTNNSRIWRTFKIYDTAYLQRYGDIRILLFAMALESLFGTSDTEIIFSLSLRTARFLMKVQDERKKTFQDIKKAYNIRSSIVHGLRKKLSETELKNAEITLRECVRKSLLKIMKDSDLINTFDGPVEEYNAFLTDLVLNNG